MTERDIMEPLKQGQSANAVLESARRPCFLIGCFGRMKGGYGTTYFEATGPLRRDDFLSDISARGFGGLEPIAEDRAAPGEEHIRSTREDVTLFASWKPCGSWRSRKARLMPSSTT